MNYKLKTLRDGLIAEAINSPMLLSDLARLETYVSESYNSRSFIELLQNADDAGATMFYVKRTGNYLLVANNGRAFDINDLESLCRSASSNKARGTSIGYRGIGFKSVVSFAKEVHLISGEYEITFSKELSKMIIPQANKVPLIRIPHEIETSVLTALSDEIKKMKDEGYNTIFIFTGGTANQIDDEYTSFASTILLFLNHIRVININLSKKITTSISVIEETDKGKHLRISTTEAITDWFVCSNNNCCIAFYYDKGKIARLPKSDAIIHAFLPTEDSCGLGVVINGDFSTDPSRRHLILDETTKNVISSFSQLYASLLHYALSNNDNNMTNALMPYYDLALIQLMKPSFEKEFSVHLKEAIGSNYLNIKLTPAWFNTEDYVKIMVSINNSYITPECAEVPGLDGVLKYLGCKTDDIDSILTKVSNADISVLGYAQLAATGIKRVLMNNTIGSLTTTPVILSNGQIQSLKDIDEQNGIIDENFILLMNDNGLSRQEFDTFLSKMNLNNILKAQNTNKTTNNKPKEINGNNSFASWFNNVSNSRQAPTTSGIQKWRSAEENTLAALNANGFNLRDVSKQNIGYDLEGTDSNGCTIFIEVKSLEYAGQKFRMTNNEFAAAQYRPGTYYIALVIQKPDSFEISLIKDPINSLNFNRQCVQWVWECDEYEYKPLKFEL